MDQSRRGVIQVLEAKMCPLVVAIPRFIQLGLPLPPLKLMDQSRCGVVRVGIATTSGHIFASKT
jgi:hypothetical protein